MMDYSVFREALRGAQASRKTGWVLPFVLGLQDGVPESIDTNGKSPVHTGSAIKGIARRYAKETGYARYGCVVTVVEDGDLWVCIPLPGDVKFGGEWSEDASGDEPQTPTNTRERRAAMRQA